jgi:Caspase domain
LTEQGRPRARPGPNRVCRTQPLFDRVGLLSAGSRRQGFCCPEQGARSRGSTVDLGIVPSTITQPPKFDPAALLKPCTVLKGQRFEDGTIDLGTEHDCLDPQASTISIRSDLRLQRCIHMIYRCVNAGGIEGEAMPKKRGAVVIGVNKTGALPALEASARAAEDFGKWLANEGFEVVIITDQAEPVVPSQIAKAIERFVKTGTFEQLVIYFSGHGYWKNEAEIWLLSGAPADANAAISWAETAEFAKDCGIPSVVMISDACRTIPSTSRALKVRGSIVFPNEDVQRSRAKVDKFMAAAQGTPAYEAPIGKEKVIRNVFTHCFLQAFERPDADMVREIIEDGKVIKIIPNRKLGRYLEREVTSLLANIDIRLSQLPDAEVLSDDTIYIGKAKVQPAAADWTGDIADVAPATPVVHMRDVASFVLNHAMGSQATGMVEEARPLSTFATREFNDLLAKVGTIVHDIRPSLSATGFAIVGATISDAIVASGEPPIISSPGNGQEPGIILIEQQRTGGCTVVVRFANGCGTALAALNGFIGHVVVDGRKIVNVSYVPAENSHRRADYNNRRQRLDRLRAAAAAAAQFGVFRLNDTQRAGELAEQIRVEKGLDPTLGMYAAYAYSEADRRDDVVSVLDYMVEDLQCKLFDVAMLARKITERDPTNLSIVPFCPMLTQGWNLLRARGVTLPDVLDHAQDELEPALWTTFAPARAQAIIDAIRHGRLGEIR